MIIQGDCLVELKKLKENSVASIVTDPPAGIAFMGKEWDKDKGGRDEWIKWMQGIASECLRVIKPGGHALVWALPRTAHWTTTAWENAGFEVRDVLAHLFGSGFAKSHNIGKAVDKLQGNEREKICRNPNSRENCDKSNTLYESGIVGKTDTITKGNSPFEGYGTALKPAREDWILLRKPLSEKTIAENCLKWGTGGLRIDDCRVGTIGARFNGRKVDSDICGKYGTDKPKEDYNKGRFPANITHSGEEEVLEVFPESKSTTGKRGGQGFHNCLGRPDKKIKDGDKISGHNDSGSASRFFYCAKPSKTERNNGTNNYLIINICVGNMEQDISPKRAILELTEKWLIELFGKKTMEKCQMDITSTIKTETKKTTISIILSCSQHLNIKDYIADALKMKRESGGSLVENAEIIKELKQIIIKELTEYILIANPVLSKSQLKISVNENNFHSTCKPLKLMQYYTRLITPKGGTCLDPFAGSGTTGIACVKEGFDFIGIEQEADYIKIAKARIKAAELEKKNKLNFY